MGKYISPETIEKILERVDIVEIISDYLPLRKRGKNFVTLCPFHPEKKPSFNVSRERQIFHCFGCGKGGDVFTFLMEWEKISYPEAVKTLGERVGVPVSWEESHKVSLKERLYQINQKIAEFFHRKLKEKKEVLDYLRKRKINSESIEKFKLGYAPSVGETFSFLRKEKFSGKDLETLGLLREGLPYFQKRLIFPIFNPQGKVLGFGGRTLDETLPKYLNSSQSPLFEKGSILYGIHLSRQEILRKREVILVEGYTDLLLLYQEGIKNVVASLGTSLTQNQARILKRHSDRVLIAYDADSAGTAATLRGIDLLLEKELEVKIIPLPPNSDPAEIVTREGRDAFLHLKEKAMQYFDFRLEGEIKKYPHPGGREKLEIIKNLHPTFLKVPSFLEQNEFIRKIGKRLGLEETLVRKELGRLKKKKTPSPSPTFLGKRKEEDFEKMLLHFILTRGEEVLQVVREKWNADKFSHPQIREVVRVLLSSPQPVSPSSLISLVGEECAPLVSSCLLSPDPFPLNDPQKEVLELIKKLEKLRKKNQGREILERIKRVEKEGEREEAKKYLEDFLSLKKKLERGEFYG